jgi:hypothetical protein
MATSKWPQNLRVQRLRTSALKAELQAVAHELRSITATHKHKDSYMGDPQWVARTMSSTADLATAWAHWIESTSNSRHK